MVARVQESIVAHLPSGEVNKHQVSKSLHMSTRTLQRRLQEEGSSFVEILNETRRELALQYIQDDSLPLKEVSYLLGYSNSTTFSKAFKRWTGKKPSEARI
jgi:AraC-like DNA-binding protein